MSKRKGVMLAKKMTPALLAKMPEQVYFQPKVNGMRCRAKKIDGKVWLFSSQGNVINSVPHVNAALAEAFKDEWNTQLDGELYNHGMPVQDIGAICRKTTRLDERYKEISYYIFDFINTQIQQRRLDTLCGRNRTAFNGLADLSIVRTYDDKKGDWQHWFDTFVADGYEGLIIRDPSAFYKEGKASCLLKVKKMLKGTFRIVGLFQADDIKGVQTDMLGGLMLEAENGESFKCGAGCLPHNERKRHWKGISRLRPIGNRQLKIPGFEKAVIEYPELTKRGVPHMPVLKEIL